MCGVSSHRVLRVRRRRGARGPCRRVLVLSALLWRASRSDPAHGYVRSDGARGSDTEEGVSRRTEFIEAIVPKIQEGMEIVARAPSDEESQRVADGMLRQIEFLTDLAERAAASTDEEWEREHPQPGFFARFWRGFVSA